MKLQEVARLESGHTPSRREPTYWGGDIPWLSLKDMSGLDGRYIFDTVDHPTELGIANSSARILPKGTVAFCRTASVGNAVILGRDMATSQDFANWVCGPDLLPEYLLAALLASGAEFDREKRGSTHKTIYMPVLEEFSVLLPPLHEQRRIADIVDKADAVRRKRREALALTDDLLRATFLEMFGDPVTNPRGWPTRRVEEIAVVQSGLQVTATRDALPRKVPYLRVANVYRDRLLLDEVKEMGVTDAEFERARLQAGDVLVVEGHGNPDEVGRSAVWDDSVNPCVHQNHLIRVRPDPRTMQSVYLSAFINSPSGRRQMLGRGKTTSGLNTISVSNVKSVDVLFPSLNVQNRFCEVVRSIREEAARLTASVTQADALFASLQHRAFRGEL